jgi:mono/diheme cytochrome c family protein
MPVFQGQVSEEQIIQLLAYIKTLKAPPGAATSVATAPAGTPRTQ